MQVRHWSSHLSYDSARTFIRSQTTGSGPVISVGSGAAQLEASLDLPGRSMICIDPDPSEYQHLTPAIQPSWSTVESMLESEPTPVGCTLLLIWPSFSGYDIEAIRRLQPAEVFILYEVNGCAGSEQLHQWMHDSPDTGYELSGTIQHWVDNGPFMGPMCYTLERFVRR